MTMFGKNQRWNKYFQYLKGVLFCSLFFILFWLFYKNFAPRGELVLNYDFDRAETSFFSSKKGLEKPEKVIDSNISYSRVTGNPAEFSLQLPRMFKKVAVELEYTSNYPLLYLSAKKKKSPSYVSKILEFGLGGENWRKITDQGRGLILFQQYQPVKQQDNSESEGEKEDLEIKLKPSFDYNQVQYFLDDLEGVVKRREKKIAYFNYDLSSQAEISDYQPTSEKIIFDKTIRGQHQLVVYLGENESFDLDFYYQDLNKYSGPDRFNVVINRGDRNIARYQEKDDGDETASKKPTALRNMHVIRHGLEPGKYLVNLDISDDLYVRRIEAKQKYLAFQNHLFLEDAQQSSVFYTDAKSLSLHTLHNDGLEQTIASERQIYYDQLELEAAENDSPATQSQSVESQLDSIKKRLTDKINVEQRNTFYTLETPGVVNKVSIPKNDLIIKYGGLISVDSDVIYKLGKLEEFVYPLQKNFDYQGADYIITDYFDQPQNKGPFKVAKQQFDLTELEVDQENKVNFSLNIPGYDRNKSDVKISAVKFTLEKEPWDFDFFMSKIKQLGK